MLIFAKDIGTRDHKHALEDKLPEIKQYMEYQRKLVPIHGGASRTGPGLQRTR